MRHPKTSSTIPAVLVASVALLTGCRDDTAERSPVCDEEGVICEIDTTGIGLPGSDDASSEDDDDSGDDDDGGNRVPGGDSSGGADDESGDEQGILDDGPGDDSGDDAPADESGDDEPGEGSSDGGETDGGSSDGGDSDGGDSDGGSTDGGSSDGGDSDGGSTDGGVGSNTSPGDSDEGGSSDGGSSDGGGGDDYSIAGFPVPAPFGDSVLELDLVGEWALPTTGPAPTYNIRFIVEDDGWFTWTEYDASCGIVRHGDGVLWVSGPQMQMLFHTWIGNAPWDVMGKYGWNATAPFFMRLAYAPVAGHVAISAPAALRAATAWRSRGYARTIGGTTGEDTWVSEAELWDIAPGDDTADIVARDRWTLQLADGELATLTTNRWWFEDGLIDPDPPIVSQSAWSDDDMGNATIGVDPYAYVGNRLASFAPGDNFLINGPTDCGD